MRHEVSSGAVAAEGVVVRGRGGRRRTSGGGGSGGGGGGGGERGGGQWEQTMGEKLWRTMLRGKNGEFLDFSLSAFVCYCVSRHEILTYVHHVSRGNEEKREESLVPLKASRGIDKNETSARRKRRGVDTRVILRARVVRASVAPVSLGVN